MNYTLGQAAKATGKTKSTIAKAIAKGRITGQKNDIGQYTINPAELHRVYPPLVENGLQVDDTRPKEDPTLRNQITHLKAALEAEKAIRHHLEGELTLTHNHLTAITSLLGATQTPHTEKKRGFLGLFRRS